MAPGLCYPGACTCRGHSSHDCVRGHIVRRVHHIRLRVCRVVAQLGQLLLSVCVGVNVNVGVPVPAPATTAPAASVSSAVWLLDCLSVLWACCNPTLLPPSLALAARRQQGRCVRVQLVPPLCAPAPSTRKARLRGTAAQRTRTIGPKCLGCEHVRCRASREASLLVKRSCTELLCELLELTERAGA